MQLWLAMAQSPVERERVEHHLTNQHVDGVLLLSLHDADPLPDAAGGARPADRARRPARPGCCDRAPSRRGSSTWTTSAAPGRPSSTCRPRGRRRIATIAGPQDMGVGLARLAGYREAVEATGLPVDPSLIAYGDFSEGSGAAGMRRLLDACPDLDAVFVASDLMAFGALRTLREAGRRVPEDVAVIGFDDAPIARQAEPPLTTVFQPVEEMGRQMARLLVARIRGDELPPRTSCWTPTIAGGARHPPSLATAAGSACALGPPPGVTAAAVRCLPPRLGPPRRVRGTPAWRPRGGPNPGRRAVRCGGLGAGGGRPAAQFALGQRRAVHLVGAVGQAQRAGLRPERGQRGVLADAGRRRAPGWPCR